MGKGRKALSDEQKRLRGTDQPCRLSGGTSGQKSLSTVSTVSNNAILSSLPKSGLKGTAKKIYAIVGTELLNRGVLDTLGLDLVIAYCREMGLYNDMMRDIEKEGATISVETKSGSITQVNPKRKVAESALSAAKALASDFGLAPTSRARVLALVAGAMAKKDDFADFEDIEEQ